MQLKKDWKEVEHASGKYWYNKRTMETTRDMPLARPPNIAVAVLAAEHGGGPSLFEHCRHCNSTVLADVRYKALDDGRGSSRKNHWLQRRCCPLCDELLDYTTVAEPLTSTRPAKAADKPGVPVSRQESFARRLARKAVPSFSSETKKANERSTSTVAEAEVAKAPSAEDATSSTRAKRISLKRSRLENVGQVSTSEMKSPRVESDQIKMVIGTKVNGTTSGETAKFELENEVA